MMPAAYRMFAFGARLESDSEGTCGTVVIGSSWLVDRVGQADRSSVGMGKVV